MRLVIARPALQDVRSIGDWIAQDDPLRADTFVEEIQGCCRDLTQNPEAFPVDPDFAEHGLRRRAFGRYVIFYRIEPGRVLVLGVVHSARDMTPIVHKRLR